MATCARIKTMTVVLEDGKVVEFGKTGYQPFIDFMYWAIQNEYLYAPDVRSTLHFLNQWQPDERQLLVEGKIEEVKELRSIRMSERYPTVFKKRDT